MLMYRRVAEHGRSYVIEEEDCCVVHGLCFATVVNPQAHAFEAISSPYPSIAMITTQPSSSFVPTTTHIPVPTPTLAANLSAASTNRFFLAVNSEMEDDATVV
ncbi:hypothetical protein BC936DRAFT_138362, partial [Jimgerdemannia flammicorona]